MRVINGFNEIDDFAFFNDLRALRAGINLLDDGRVLYYVPSYKNDDSAYLFTISEVMVIEKAYCNDGCTLIDYIYESAADLYKKYKKITLKKLKNNY